jgi:hypothetical protein
MAAHKVKVTILIEWIIEAFIQKLGKVAAIHLALPVIETNDAMSSIPVRNFPVSTAKPLASMSDSGPAIGKNT